MICPMPPEMIDLKSPRRPRVSTVACERPPEADRAFRSEAVDRFVGEVIAELDDPQVARMFANCYPNTLDTTIRFDPSGGPEGGGDTFVITGDIPAMWLRDSAAQVWPYLHLADQDPHLAAMIEGLIARHARCVLVDPYANGFLVDRDSLETEFATDRTEMRPGVYERKWEVDSLAYVLRLSCGYHAVTGSTKPFDAVWLRSVRTILETFETQRREDAFEAYR